MKKQYIKPVVETLQMDEQMELLQGSIIKDHATDLMDARVDNMAFAEDEDISEDVY